MRARALSAAGAVLCLLSLRADDPATAPPPGSITPAVVPAEPVQVDVTGLLNARVVTTFTDGRVAPFSADIDGTGGVVTMAAAKSLGGDPAHALSDNGIIPPETDHPRIVLHYSNSDEVNLQVRRMAKPDDFSIAVPAQAYAKMLLVFTSAGPGPAKLHFTLSYQDGSTDERDEVCPDWRKSLEGISADCVVLSSGLAEWSKKKMLEPGNHAIFALELRPTPDKVLVSVAVHKTKPLVCFWGATGVPAR